MCFRRTFVLELARFEVAWCVVACWCAVVLLCEPLLFADELVLDVVAGFFLCVLCVELEPCAYPTVIAAHNTAPISQCQPNPELFVTTST